MVSPGRSARAFLCQGMIYWGRLSSGCLWWDKVCAMGLFKKSTNWDIIASQPNEDQIRYRNVHEEQQLERSQIAEAQKPYSRMALTALAVTAVMVVFWCLWSMLSWMIASLTTFSGENFASFIVGGPEGEITGAMPLIWYFRPTAMKVFCTAGAGLACFFILYQFLMRNLEAQNLLTDTKDINQYRNDQHIALPEEVHRKFDFFPDAGATSNVQVSSMISHAALSNKGLKKIEMVNRHCDEDDDTEFYAAIRGERDALDIVKVPIIDEEFQDALFEASGALKEHRRQFDTTKIPYNPGNKNREKLKGFDTVADLINGDWEFPLYEPQRPGGAYIVDTDPVNTMVLAITRAGKGQTVIEPTIDMWLRERRPNNIVINDPKGELLVKNYVPAAVRGFQPVQFNLINSIKTDIYNPLVLAAQAAREGDETKCAQYVENIANVFFPVDGADDPVWPNAANNAFKRAAYILIDYYLEEERELRDLAAATNMDPGTLETELDNLWGKVTLYNCYQLFVQLSAKKRGNPGTALKKELDKEEEVETKTGVKGPWLQLKASDTKRYNELIELQNRESALWDQQPEIDLLTLFCNATAALPRNSIRTLAANADNALRAMGGAEKMIASVYGIAITAMSFFTDPTISTLTSGTPSQNVDLAGLSFPRRIGVQFHPDFMEKHHLVGLQAKWSAYSDDKFTDKLDSDFEHTDLIGRGGWARYYFKGIFPEDTAYLKLEVKNPQTNVLVFTFYFRFTKSHQKSLNGRYYVKDPVLDEKIILNGLLTELVCENGEFVEKKRTFKRVTVALDEGDVSERIVQQPAIKADLVRYSEKPKVVFLVTPPHLMKYAKIILILVKQLVDLNFDQSYMTKSNQKPLFKTRFMLDELGNLQSEGHGIDGFETMLSIGLGQEQQFTLILQTLQQLRAVYGSDVDKVVQGNAQTFDSLIATDRGWKRMGDIAVGDTVITPKGKKSQVVGVFPRGKRKVYRVIRRDGSVCEACNEHLWKVKVKK